MATKDEDERKTAGTKADRKTPAPPKGDGDGGDDLDAQIDERIKKVVGESLAEFFGEAGDAGKGKGTQKPPDGSGSVWKRLILGA